MRTDNNTGLPNGWVRMTEENIRKMKEEILLAPQDWIDRPIMVVRVGRLDVEHLKVTLDMDCSQVFVAISNIDGPHCFHAIYWPSHEMFNPRGSHGEIHLTR